MLHNIIFALTT